jgi:hypothetical protein
MWESGGGGSDKQEEDIMNGAENHFVTSNQDLHNTACECVQDTETGSRVRRWSNRLQELKLLQRNTLQPAYSETAHKTWADLPRWKSATTKEEVHSNLQHTFPQQNAS